MHSLSLLVLLLPQLMISGLGHRSYKVREAAHRSLAHLQDQTTLEANLRHPCPETRARVHLLLLSWERERLWDKAGRMRPKGYPRTPWLSLPNHWVESRHLAEARWASPESEDGSPYWKHYASATRYWTFSQLLQRRPLSEIQGELNRMADEERRWITEHGSNYSPPIRIPR